MKRIIVIFLLNLSFNILFGQSNNFQLSSIESYLDNKVLIEGCDTANFSIRLNIAEIHFPLELTISGTTDSLDFWTNLETDTTIIFEEDAAYTYLPVQIFPFADTLLESGETLTFTFRKSTNHEMEFTLVFLDEGEQLNIVNPLTESYCNGNSWGGWEISMEIDSSFTDIPHEYIFLDLNEYQLGLYYSNYWGCYTDEYDEFSCPLSDSIQVEVRALNCVVDTVFADVFEASTGSIDTFTCVNEREMDLGSWSINLVNTEEIINLYEGNTYGCDSTLSIFVDFLPVQINLEQIIKSPDEIYFFDGTPITEYGNYEAHYVNEYGCDSSFVATIIPYADLDILNDIPNGITQYSTGCEAGICLPLFYGQRNEFDYLINGEMLLCPELNSCDVNNTLYSRNISPYLVAGNQPRKIKNLRINNVEYPDFYCESVGEFAEVINFYNDDLDFLGLNNFRLFSKTESIIRFDEKLLNTGYQIPRTIPINLVEESYQGIFLPMPVGTHELKIKHKNSPAEKVVTVNLETHIPLELATLELNYTGEVDQRVNFPLPVHDLCGNIVSATENCSNIPSSIVDFTLSDQGLLSFKPLVEANFSFCIEICDEYDICQIIILNINFAGAEDYIIQRNLYPNPAQNKVTLIAEDEFNIEKVIVHDAIGRHVEALFFEPESEVEIDVSKYPEGVYFLTVHINGENYLHKLLIQR